LPVLESIIFVNTISAMKLTIQGGAWSEVGKQTEKSLLVTIFQLLKIPKDDYILVFDEMKKKNLVGNREIDAIIFNRDKEPLTVELKLLGIGNPEIGDEALARKVDLFLIDRLTDMMIKESEKVGVKVSPQVLREWFCQTMGELGVPDRFVDAFCGRVPKSVLGKRYTDYSPQRLKEIYYGAGLKVLS